MPGGTTTRSRGLAVLLAAAAMSLGSFPGTAFAADPAVDTGLLYQWKILGGVPAPGQHPNASYGLLNQTADRFLKYGSRTFGINLVWGVSHSASTLRNVQFRYFGPLTAIFVSGGGYLRYQSRTYGINLGWSTTPVAQWRVDPIQVLDRSGTPTGNYMYRIYNTVARDYLVYCPRTFGINLVWSRDRSGGSCRSWWDRAARKVAEIAAVRAVRATVPVVIEVLYTGQLHQAPSPER